MTIRLNGENEPLGENETVAKLLLRIGASAARVAVLVNDSTVAPDARSTHVLRDGDCVEILTIAAGG